MHVRCCRAWLRHCCWRAVRPGRLTAAWRTAGREFVHWLAQASAKITDPVIPRIAGRKAADIVTFMREYRSGAWPSSVMGRIAKGFDDQQIDAIAAWLPRSRSSVVCRRVDIS